MIAHRTAEAQQERLQLKDKHAFQILSKCPEHGERTREASLPLPCAGESRDILKTRLARDLPRTLGLQNVMLSCSRLLQMTSTELYKVTFTVLKTFLAGRKQLLTFLPLL